MSYLLTWVSHGNSEDMSYVYLLLTCIGLISFAYFVEWVWGKLRPEAGPEHCPGCATNTESDA